MLQSMLVKRNIHVRHRIYLDTQSIQNLLCLIGSGSDIKHQGYIFFISVLGGGGGTNKHTIKNYKNLTSA